MKLVSYRTLFQVNSILIIHIFSIESTVDIHSIARVDTFSMKMNVSRKVRHNKKDRVRNSCLILHFSKRV